MADDSVRALVDSILKHKGFKRLAAYSISSLNKKCTPPSNGWQENAKSAFEANADTAIAGVLTKNCGAEDADLVLLALTQLQAQAAAGCAAGLLEKGTLRAVQSSYETFCKACGTVPIAAEHVAKGLVSSHSVYSPSGPHAEVVAVTESFFRLLFFVSAQARAEASQPSSGIIASLLAALPRLPTPNAVRLAVSALEHLSRSEAGLQELMSSPTTIATILQFGCVPFVLPSGSGGAGSAGGGRGSHASSTSVVKASAASNRVGLVSPTSAAGSSSSLSSAGSSSSSARLNSHLEPAFRLLDRIARREAGLAQLRKQQAVAKLAPAVEFASSHLDRTTSALGVRVLARILGNDVGGLISKIEAVSGGANPENITLHEGEFAASLLSSLSSDVEVASKLVMGGHCGRICALFDFNGGKAASVKIAGHLAAAIRRVAAQTTDGLVAFVDQDAVRRIMTAIRASFSFGGSSDGSAGLSHEGLRRLVVEGFNALADLTSTEDDMMALDGTDFAGISFVVRTLCLSSGVTGDGEACFPSVSASCCALLYSVLSAGYHPDDLVGISGSSTGDRSSGANVITAALTAMQNPGQASSDHVDLQVFGSLLLFTLSESGAGSTAAAAAATTADASGASPPPATTMARRHVAAIVASGGLAQAVVNLQAIAAGRLAGNDGGASSGFAAALQGASGAGGALASLLSSGNRRSIAVAGGGANSSLEAASRLSAAVGKGRKGNKRDDDENEGDESSGGGIGSTGFRAGGVHLAAVSFSLLTSLCKNSPENIAAAKSKGLIRAMLGAFTRYSEADVVYTAFVDLVDAIIFSDEVTEAVKSVAGGVSNLKAVCGDPALFSIAEHELGNEGIIKGVSLEEDSALQALSPRERSTAIKRKRDEMTANSLATQMTEDLCLLEAVTSSPRLAAVLVASEGVAVLVRAMAIVSTVKATGSASSSSSGGGAGKVKAALAFGGASSGGTAAMLAEALQEEALLRASNTLTGLARLNVDALFGVPGLDPIPSSAVPSNGVVPSSGPGAAGLGGSSAGSAAAGFRGFLRNIATGAGGGGGASGGGGSSANGAYGKDRLLSRAGLLVASTGGGLARRRRLAVAAASMENGGFVKLQKDIAATLFRPVVVKSLLRCLNTRSNLPAAAAAACVCLGVLGLGKGGDASTSPLDLVVNLSAVEAITGVIRSYTNTSVPVLVAAVNALGCLTIAGRAFNAATGLLTLPAPAETVGSAAVASRGATRQVIRELQAAAVAQGNAPAGAKWVGHSGQLALCTILRVLLGVADTSKGAELLRKQGTVEALISTLDATPSSFAAVAGGAGDGSSGGSAEGGGNGDGGSGTPGLRKTKAGGSSDGDDASSGGGASIAQVLAGGDAFAGLEASGAGGDGVGGSGSDGLDGIGVGGHSAEANALIIAVLSRLMDTKDLMDAVKIIKATAGKVASYSLKGAGITLCTVALTTVLALSGTEAGVRAGPDIWGQAIEAVTSLLTSLVGTATNTLPLSASGGGSSVVESVKLPLSALASAGLLNNTLRSLSSMLVARDALTGGRQPNGNNDIQSLWTACSSSIASSAVTIAHRGVAGAGATPRGSGPSVNASNAAAQERITSVFAGASSDALASLLVCIESDEKVRRKLVAASPSSSPSGATSSGESNDLRRLVDTSNRLCDAGRYEGVGLVLDSLLQLSYVTPSQQEQDGALRNADGIKALLAVGAGDAASNSKATTAGMLCYVIPEVMASGCPPAVAINAVGSGLTLLGRLAGRNKDLADSLRSSPAVLEPMASPSAGSSSSSSSSSSSAVLSVVKQALSRYCDTGAVAEDGVVDDAEIAAAELSAKVIEGAATVVGALAGHAVKKPRPAGTAVATPSSGDAAQASEDDWLLAAGNEDSLLAAAIVTTVGADPTGSYMSDPKAMTAVCTMIAAVCTPAKDAKDPIFPNGGNVLSACADLAKANILDADGRAIVVGAMSSPSADGDLLKAGAKALSALGGGTSGAALEVRKAVAALLQCCGLPIPQGLLASSIAAAPAVEDAVAAQAAVSGDSGSTPLSAPTPTASAPSAPPAPSPLRTGGMTRKTLAQPGALADAASAAAAAAAASVPAIVIPKLSLGVALRELDASARNLAAVLAGVDAFTPLIYRYVFDTLAAAVNAAVGVQFAANNGQLATQLSASKESELAIAGLGITAGSPGGSAGPSSAASAAALAMGGSSRTRRMVSVAPSSSHSHHGSGGSDIQAARNRTMSRAITSSTGSALTTTPSGGSGGGGVHGKRRSTRVGSMALGALGLSQEDAFAAAVDGALASAMSPSADQQHQQQVSTAPLSLASVIAVCDSVVVSGVQGVARISSAALEPNKRAGHAKAGVGNGGAGAAASASQLHLTHHCAFEAMTEEKVKFGDPGLATNSALKVLQAHQPFFGFTSTAASSSSVQPPFGTWILKGHAAAPAPTAASESADGANAEGSADAGASAAFAAPPPSGTLLIRPPVAVSEFVDVLTAASFKVASASALASASASAISAAAAKSTFGVGVGRPTPSGTARSSFHSPGGGSMMGGGGGAAAPSPSSSASSSGSGSGSLPIYTPPASALLLTPDVAEAVSRAVQELVRACEKGNFQKVVGGGAELLVAPSAAAGAGAGSGAVAADAASGVSSPVTAAAATPSTVAANGPSPASAGASGVASPLSNKSKSPSQRAMGGTGSSSSSLLRTKSSSSTASSASSSPSNEPEEPLSPVLELGQRNLLSLVWAAAARGFLNGCALLLLRDGHKDAGLGGNACVAPRVTLGLGSSSSAEGHVQLAVAALLKPLSVPALVRRFMLGLQVAGPVIQRLSTTSTTTTATTTTAATNSASANAPAAALEVTPANTNTNNNEGEEANGSAPGGEAAVAAAEETSAPAPAQPASATAASASRVSRLSLGKTPVSASTATTAAGKSSMMTMTSAASAVACPYYDMSLGWNDEVAVPTASVGLQLLMSAEAISRPKGQALASLLEDFDRQYGIAYASDGGGGDNGGAGAGGSKTGSSSDGADASAPFSKPPFFLPERFLRASVLMGNRLSAVGCLHTAAAAFAINPSTSTSSGGSAPVSSSIENLPAWTLLMALTSSWASSGSSSSMPSVVYLPSCPAFTAAGSGAGTSAKTATVTTAGERDSFLLPLSSLSAIRVAHALVAALLPLVKAAPAPPTSSDNTPPAGDINPAASTPGAVNTPGGKAAQSQSPKGTAAGNKSPKGKHGVRSELTYDQVTVNGRAAVAGAASGPGTFLAARLLHLWRVAAEANGAVTHDLAGLQPQQQQSQAQSQPSQATKTEGSVEAAAGGVAGCPDASPHHPPHLTIDPRATPMPMELREKSVNPSSSSSSSSASGEAAAAAVPPATVVINATPAPLSPAADPATLKQQALHSRLVQEGGRALADVTARLLGHCDFDDDATAAAGGSSSASPTAASTPSSGSNTNTNTNAAAAMLASVASHLDIFPVPSSAGAAGINKSLASSPSASASAAAAAAVAAQELPLFSSLVRAALRQRGGDVFATALVQVVRRLCGLNSPAIHAHAPKDPSTGELHRSAALLHRSRVRALRNAGIFKAVALCMGVHSTSRLYIHEAIRLLLDVSEECALADGADMLSGKAVVAALDLNELCLKVLQTSVKKHGEEGKDEFIAREGGKLIAALSEVYSTMSARGFLEALQKAVEAAEVCVHQRKGVVPSTADPKDGAASVYFARMGAQRAANNIARTSLSPTNGAKIAEAAAASAGAGEEEAGAPTSSSSSSSPSSVHIPPDFSALLARLETLLTVCDKIEADAIPAIPSDLLLRAQKSMRVYAKDGKVAGTLCRALVRAADNINNVETLSRTEVIEEVVGLSQHHSNDGFVAEPAVAFFRPLSVFPECVKTMKQKAVVPMLCSLAKAHRTTMLAIKARNANDKKGGAGGGGSSSSSSANNRGEEGYGVDPDILKALTSPAAASAGPSTGTTAGYAPLIATGTASGSGSGSGPRKSLIPGPPPVPGTADAAAAAAASASASSSEAAGPEATEPRIVHHAVQVIANVACDQEEDDPKSIPDYSKWAKDIGEGCAGGVARVVASDGITVLRTTMEAHLERPRVLEDSLCAMSNIAYSTDNTRLAIGRTSAPIIVRVLRAFSADAYLFSMALRAVGNLTRCDENIVATVGQGVIEGIVEGMGKNAHNREVLRLAADVIGNLASIDEDAMDRKEGLKALRAGLAARKQQQQQAGPSSSASSSSSSAAAAAASGTSSIAAALASGDDDSVSLQDAVTSWLIDDGAHVGLCNAMVQHRSDADLVSACLRSLQYMAESKKSIERIEQDVAIAKNTCLVMRSCDFDPELCVRGSLLLAQMLRHQGSAVQQAAFEAGAAQVLLSVLDVHQGDYEVASNLAKVFLLLGASQEPFLTAARELNSPATLLRVVEECRRNLPPNKPQAGGRGGRSSSSVSGAGGPLGQEMDDSSLAVAGAALGAYRGQGDEDNTIYEGDGDELGGVKHRAIVGLSPQESHLLVRQCLAILSSWAAASTAAASANGAGAAAGEGANTDANSASNAELVKTMLPQAIATFSDLVLPSNNPLFQDGILYEACLKVLAASVLPTLVVSDSSNSSNSSNPAGGASGSGDSVLRSAAGVLSDKNSPNARHLAAVTTILADSGALRLLTPIPTAPVHLDRPSLSKHAIVIMTALGTCATPAVAMTAMVEGNCHGVLTGLAAHWALKSDPHASEATSAEEAAVLSSRHLELRKCIYETAGSALRLMLETSLPLRRARAIEEAKARLSEQRQQGSATPGGRKSLLPSQAAAGAGAGAPTGAAGSSSSSTNSSLRTLSSFHSLSAAASVKDLLAEEKAVQRTISKRATEAEHVARKLNQLLAAAAASGSATAPPLSATDVLELRAGLMPWLLFPRSDVELLVSSTDPEDPAFPGVCVWFLPSMRPEQPKTKTRKMRLSVTPDLKTLEWQYESRHYKKTMSWSLPLHKVFNVRVGQQYPVLKKGFFGKGPDASKGIVLDAENGTSLFHAEVTGGEGSGGRHDSKDEEHDSFLRCMAVLCQYARARAGVFEPLPEVADITIAAVMSTANAEGETATATA